MKNNARDPGRRESAPDARRDMGRSRIQAVGATPDASATHPQRSDSMIADGSVL